jgi:hypothetical protein
MRTQQQQKKDPGGCRSLIKRIHTPSPPKISQAQEWKVRVWNNRMCSYTYKNTHTKNWRELSLFLKKNPIVVVHFVTYLRGFFFSSYNNSFNNPPQFFLLFFLILNFQKDARDDDAQRAEKFYILAHYLLSQRTNIDRHTMLSRKWNQNRPPLA